MSAGWCKLMVFISQEHVYLDIMRYAELSGVLVKVFGLGKTYKVWRVVLKC